ncbi:MAG TPA: isoprenylcysteine carboxylmethyltransferase family protein [Anaerolineales bacterium]|nr:isoprenylcysteine carboxylmethyltransferase family protein [Anaerolineales bacterium]
MAETQKTFTLRAVIQVALIVFVVPFLPMIISGQWRWWEAWAYAGLSILGFVLSRVMAMRRHPDLLAERARSMEMENAKPWDKILAPVLALGAILILIVAGLDRLFGWSPSFTISVKLISLIVIILGYSLGSWALVENRFFSGVVRIQTDRGHQVIASGPYHFIRHPGYAGALWVYLATPALLDSVWAFMPALLLAGILILRTALEDRTLQGELPGYKEYARSTRFRLIPGVW